MAAEIIAEAAMEAPQIPRRGSSPIIFRVAFPSRSLCRLLDGNFRELVLVDLVLRTTGQDLFLAPGRDVFERLAVNKVHECLFVRPLTRNQVRGIIGDVFP